MLNKPHIYYAQIFINILKSIFKSLNFNVSFFKRLNRRCSMFHFSFCIHNRTHLHFLPEAPTLKKKNTNSEHAIKVSFQLMLWSNTQMDGLKKKKKVLSRCFFSVLSFALMDVVNVNLKIFMFLLSFRLIVFTRQSVYFMGNFVVTLWCRNVKVFLSLKWTECYKERTKYRAYRFNITGLLHFEYRPESKGNPIVLSVPRRKMYMKEYEAGEGV